MKGRICFSILRGVPRDEFPATAIDAAFELMKVPPRQSKWTDHRYDPTSTRFLYDWCGDVLTMSVLSSLVVPDCGWPLAQALMQKYGCPLMELRQQDGDHWDFELWRAGELIASFSTRVAAFDYEGVHSRPWKSGNSEAVAEMWGIPSERIHRYFVDWDALSHGSLGKEKAYESDTFCYGECDQIYDFMRAIGARSPFGSPARLEFDAPTWQTHFQRQPWIRRVIRQISVKIKGTYPDVPRHTPEERRLWKLRKAHLRVVKHDLASMLENEQD